MSKSRLYFNNDTGKINFTTAGSGTIQTTFGPYEEDTRKKHEKFFGMSEDEIHKEFGLCFKETDIFIGGERQYEISSDFEAKLWLIQKGFVRYVRGKEVWNEEAIEEGWENGWSPPDRDWET